MNEDPLESSHWDDAVSSSPAIFSKPLNIKENEFEDGQQQLIDDTIPNKLSATLAASKLDEPFQLKREEQKGEEEEEEEEQEEDLEPEKHHHGKEELLSSLTKDADKPFISDSFKSPGKGDALFSDSPSKSLSLPSPGLPDEDESEATRSTATLSPSKVRRVNVYRAPRYRRSQNKSQSIDDSVDILSQSAPNPTQVATEELGPLGQTNETEQQQPTATRTDLLLQQTNQPLFKINRTPLSPEQSESSTESKPPVPEKEKIKLDITVGDPIKVRELTGAHIVYSVRTKSESDLFKAPDIIVSRRYTDFRWLYRQLQSTNPGRVIPPPPDKQAVGRFNQDFIENRRLALERMLQHIADNVNLQTDPDFIMFLQSERFSSEARERERAVASFSEHESEDSSHGTSSSGSSGNQGGFLSSLGGAFSFQVKFTEPDDFFRDKKQYIESLDLQLQSFAKSLELITQQRADLSVVTEEFSNILMTLADLEVSKKTSQIFQDFSNIQLKIKELLNRLTLQDMLTLGSTLDEYQRILVSVQKTFSQREKILIELGSAEADLNKKKASYEKYNKYNSTQLEKINILKIDIAKHQRRYDGVNERFQTINSVIKEELAKFETEKIHDFRNSIEIYLEALIESQKEVLELWETFYDLNLNDEE